MKTAQKNETSEQIKSDPLTLKEREERFRLIFENSPVGKSITGIDGSLKVNKAFCDILGYTEKELKEKKWTEITHPEDIRESQDIVNDLIAGKMESARYEKRYIHKSGRIVWTDVSTTLQRSADGRPIFFITILVDISVLKEAMEKRRISEERHRSYIELTNQVVWVTNPSGEVVEDIPYFRKFTGLTYDEVKGTGWTSALHPDDVAATLEVWQKAVKAKEPYETEYRLKRHDGIYRHFLAKGSPVFDPKGKILEWVGICTDITERKQSEIILRVEKERIRSIIDLVGDPIFVKDNNHRITLANRAFYEMFCLDEKSVIGRTLAEEVPENERQQFLEVDRKVLDTGIPDIREEELTVKDFTRTIITRKASFTDDSGEKFMVGSIHDITPRKKIEEALKEANENLEKKVKERTEELEKSKLLLEETGRLAIVGGWEIDLKTNNISWSETTCRIHEVEPGFDPNLDNAINFYAPESIPIISKCVDNAIKLGESFDEELELITAKKNRIWVRTVGKAYKENGEIIKIGGVFQDITAQKIIKDEIRQHRDHLEEIVAERTRDLDKAISDLTRSNQELEQFAYVASHDLQEPLRMVSSYTQLLERRYKDKLDQDATDFINYAVDGANRMQRLINDLLEFSRVTTKGKPLLKVDLSTVLGQAVANLHNKIQETGSMIVNDDLPFAYGDEGQLVRVFQNLLDNAMKFKGEESVRISVSAKAVDDKIQIAVSDNGIGIDKIYSERIFTIFQRLHTKAEYPGTGIGLAICKRTIERHGGKIWFESEPGKGTTFYFTLNI